MIINFSVQNFGCIKDKQTLTFEADKYSHLKDQYVFEYSGIKLLKLALIYGSNASGKTTILQALEFLRRLISDPEEKKTNRLDFSPFLFDEKTPSQSTQFSIEFLFKKNRYLYEVECSKEAVLTENLFYFKPKKSNVFKRKTDLENQLTKISLGDKIKKSNANINIIALQTNTLWNNTVLGGFLKTNIDFPELKEATDWFGNNLKRLVLPNTELDSFVTKRIDDAEISKKDVIEILKKADFNITDLLIKEEEGDLPDGLIEFLEKQLNAPNDKIAKLKKKGKLTTVNLELEHTVNNNKYRLPFDLESQGTKRFYGFAGLLSILTKKSVIFPIDELESSLHPDLFEHFLLSFLLNSENSQLIATTHNREILNNRDIFRNDAIWFTDRSENGSTILYSLSDFDSSVVRDTSNILNAYKSGKLGGKPNLGDYYITS